MVEDIITSQAVIRAEEMQYWAESENTILKYIKGQLAVDMAYSIVDKVELQTEVDRDLYMYHTIYKIQCAVITPKRYRELLKAENTLNEYKKRFINVK